MPLRNNILALAIRTPNEVQDDLAARLKARRLAQDLTQAGLAARAGVGMSSLRRFEGSGLIAIDALLRIALVLDCLEDFDKVCAEDRRAAQSLDEMVEAAAKKPRRRASIK